VHYLETGMADDSDSEGHTVEQNKHELLAYFQVIVYRYCILVPSQKIDKPLSFIDLAIELC